jgi:ankyrin repeat protein
VRGEKYLDFVKLFIERGIDLNNIDDSGYHILYPVIRQSKELKDTTLTYETLLVENGLDLNHVSEDGRNILHFAINDSDSRADMNS